MDIRVLLLACCCLHVSVTLTRGDENVTTDSDNDKHVLILTPDGFEEELGKNQFTFVTFYSPDCQHSDALHPEFAKAAARLAAESSDVVFAKMDVSEDEEFRITYEIDRYPTIKLYKNVADTREVKEYEGWRNAEDIGAWAKKRRHPGSREVTTVEEMEQILQNNAAVAVCFLPHDRDKGDSTPRAFNRACSELEHTLCLITFSPELFEYYSIDKKFTLIVFKQYDNGRDEMQEELSVMQIKKFISIATMDLVMEFGKETAPLIFDQDYIQKFLILFTSYKNDDIEAQKKILREVAAMHRNQIKFVIMDIDDVMHRRALEFFDVNAERFPAIRMVDMSGAEVLKYKPRDELVNARSMETFILGVEHGLIKEHHKIQPLPDDWDKEDVKILTGVNYKQVTEDPTKSVFVQFAAPWCGRCGLIKTPYKKLAEHYRDHPHIIIAKIDATANELPFDVTAYPSFKYYPRGSTEVLDYKGVEGTTTWIKYLDNRDENRITESDKKEEL